MRKSLVSIMAVFSFFVFCGASQALTLDSVSGTWIGASGSDITGLGTNEIRWGIPVGSEKSGLRFEGSAPPSQTIVIDEAFSLGEITHFNFATYGGADSAELEIALMFSDPVLSEDFNFSFEIENTPNDPGPPESDDIITFPKAYSSESFAIAGELYTLKLLGFGETTEELLEEFRSPEDDSNSAYLWATVTSFEQVEPVPEPGTMALLGLGLIGLGFTARRKGTLK